MRATLWPWIFLNLGLVRSASNSLFPKQDLSDTSLECSNDANESLSVNPSIMLHDQLSSVACFALVDLIASILRLDFWQNSDDLNSANIGKILKYTALPEKTKATIRHHLMDEGATDDIATFVTLVKKDPITEQKGASVILACLLSIFTEYGTYDCRCRIEDTLVDTITGHHYKESEEQKVVRARTKKLKQIKRYVMIGAASGIGGVLIGVTGGLAAPLVAAGMGSIIGAGTAAGIGTAVGATVLGSLFGVAGYKMRKRIGAIEEFVIQPISEGRSLHCVLAVSGWIEDQEERVFQQQWKNLWMSREQYILRYESKYLLELGRAIDYLMSFAVSLAVQHTLWKLHLLVGEQLAEVLLSRAHGNRPITLIGFSLGARVIFHCLMTMIKQSTFLVRIVNDVVLLGAPVSASPTQWQQISQVVGGRIINGYCDSDWLLRFIYRTMSVQFTIAGTGPVTCKMEKKIVNFNLSHLIKGHLDYSRKLTEILEAVGIRVRPYRGESILSVNNVTGELNTGVDDFNIAEERKLYPNNSKNEKEM
ncbi:Transmembrane and coiled-coil domain-containing protein 4 [Dirofilaria immitis]|nr:Transmembrane and coiled-coil domain-containing protein 4 [Dirofilaria immitis]